MIASRILEEITVDLSDWLNGKPLLESSTWETSGFVKSGRKVDTSGAGVSIFAVSCLSGVGKVGVVGF